MKLFEKIALGLLVAILVIGLYGMFNSNSTIVGADRTYTKLTKLWVSNTAATSSVEIGGTTRGQVCVWNGINYTTLTFLNNSTSTTIATTTNCTY